MDMDNLICNCGCGRWHFAGLLGDGWVVECDDCQYIEYAQLNGRYIDSEGEKLHDTITTS